MLASIQPDPIVEMVDVDVGGLRNPGHLSLERVTWSVRTGEFWVVAGLQRSGKSDLLATAAGLIPPRRGICRLFGFDTRYPNDSELRSSRLRLGFVFDGGQLLHDLTVWENIALPLRYHGNQSATQAFQQIQLLLESTGLHPWAHAYPDLMGRNWQQRAGLARALVLQPDLLMIDNPLSGLVPEEVQWWTTTLQALADGRSGLAKHPMTVIVTGGSFNPWQGTQHRSAILKDRQFQLLEEQAGGDLYPRLSPSL